MLFYTPVYNYRREKNKSGIMMPSLPGI